MAFFSVGDLYRGTYRIEHVEPFFEGELAVASSGGERFFLQMTRLQKPAPPRAIQQYLSLKDHPLIVPYLQVYSEERSLVMIRPYVPFVERLHERVARGGVEEDQILDWVKRLFPVEEVLKEKPLRMYTILHPANIGLTESGQIQVLYCGVEGRTLPDPDVDWGNLFYMLFSGNLLDQPIKKLPPDHGFQKPLVRLIQKSFNRPAGSVAAQMETYLKKRDSKGFLETLFKRSPDPSAQKKEPVKNPPAEPGPESEVSENTLPSGVPPSEVFQQRLEETRRAKEEALRQEQERLEQEAAERQAREEAARQERERLEQKAAEQQASEEAARKEQERQELEEAARSTMVYQPTKLRVEEAAHKEQERLEREAAERRAQEEAARKEQERLEQERLEREAAERQAREEAARKEQERLEQEAAERQAQEEAARKEQERLEQERLEREAAERQAREEAARKEQERLEQERLEREAVERQAREEAARKEQEPGGQVDPERDEAARPTVVYQPSKLRARKEEAARQEQEPGGQADLAQEQEQSQAARQEQQKRAEAERLQHDRLAAQFEEYVRHVFNRQSPGNN